MKENGEINIEIYAASDVGRVRPGNEDNYLIANMDDVSAGITAQQPLSSTITVKQARAGTLLAVADGLGGALAGEVASQLAVTTLYQRMSQFQSTRAFWRYAFSERLRLAIEQANLTINTESSNNIAYTGMGSTITAAGIDGDTAYLAQVGDSRCYLIRDATITQLTEDQSLVWQLFRGGYITEEEVETHDYRNVILQALGAQPAVKVEVTRLPLCRGDLLLLCSDGLSGKIRRSELLEIISAQPDLQTAVARLIERANELGGEDNITVVLARFSGAGLREPELCEPIVGELITRDFDLTIDVDTQPLTSPESDGEEELIAAELHTDDSWWRRLLCRLKAAMIFFTTETQRNS